MKIRKLDLWLREQVLDIQVVPDRLSTRRIMENEKRNI